MPTMGDLMILPLRGFSSAAGAGADAAATGAAAGAMGTPIGGIGGGHFLPLMVMHLSSDAMVISPRSFAATRSASFSMVSSVTIS